VGDDCALLRPDAGLDLAVTSDMLVEGRHFLPDAEPRALGHKALAVNLSDLAAMGAGSAEATHTIVEAIKAAGKAEPKAIAQAMWNVKVKGINGDIAFIKQGPAGKESAQNVPSVYVVRIDNGKVVKN